MASLGDGYTSSDSSDGAFSARERARGFLRLTRPGNAVAAAAFTAIGAFVGGGLLSGPLAASGAALATALSVGAGNAINDYFDREIDRINAPDRPIPSGLVAPREALVFSGCLFCGAIVAALFLPLLAIVIALFNLLALVAYTELFKGLLGVGNALVAYLGGSTFLFGGAAVGDLGVAVITLFSFAALATFARELVKDVEDVAGDREKGLRTLPIVVGERPSLTLAAGVLAVSVLASPLPYLLGVFGPAYFLLLVPADALLLYGAREGFADPSAGQARIKTGMFLAAGAFVLGRSALLASSFP
ncbi:geranylgeranylglycerol-phosphate geranylgeranyltransferase [Halobacteriales archaeon QS_8_65_32]|jgi:geranylgeranylglycerol-phosphate geranylgeranyltransferase|nr:MAG: geranylgeranylglycerol-phosphate geranylgeranyltransferase [Halobacteriales archaeon QS_8_65_32]